MLDFLFKLFKSSGKTKKDGKVAVFSSFDVAKPTELPEYQTEGSVGVDLRAVITEPVTLYPFFRRIISTGLTVKIEKGYEGQVRSRSGLAANSGVIVLNSPGTIDSDYEGEIKVILYNSDPNKPFTVNPGDRIAQMVFNPVAFADVVVNKKERGEGGLGSTGKN